MYYMGRKFEDQFLSVAIKLDYPVLSQKMDEIGAAAIRQKSNISRKAQKIIVRYSSEFLGKQLIVSEYFITELGQNNVPPTSNSIILNDKNLFLEKKP